MVLFIRSIKIVKLHMIFNLSNYKSGKNYIISILKSRFKFGLRNFMFVFNSHHTKLKDILKMKTIDSNYNLGKTNLLS